MNDPGGDPKRLTSSSNARLRSLLEAGRSEVPTDEQLSPLATQLSAALFAAGGSSSGPVGRLASAGKSVSIASTAVKVIGGVVVATALIVGTVRSLSKPESSTGMPSVSAGSPPSASSDPPEAVTTPAPLEAPAERPSPSAVKAKRTPEPSGVEIVPPIPTPTASAIPTPDPPAQAEDQEPETKVLQRAHAALAANPSQALALCTEHALRYPRGTLGQEREVIAIDALVRMGRRTEAASRAERFVKSYPASAHVRRLETLIGSKF